jgi:hypothetical protein
MYVRILAAVPTPLLALLIVGVSVGASLLGAMLVRRSVKLESLEAHTEVAGFIVNIVGVIYAVLVALIVVAVWEQYEQADTVATQEANDLADLLHVVQMLPSADGAVIHQELIEYGQTVIDVEWPAMRHATQSNQATAKLDAVWQSLRSVDPQKPTERSAYRESLGRLQDLEDARRARLLASRTGLPSILWAVMILGGIMTIGFTYFFGVRKFRAQALMTGILAALIALSLFLVYALDLPFTGSVAVSPEAMSQVLDRLH